ncbi:g5665 [Coccomyxa viridis]|uniref:G5665 protein n=1 Tax=Coccomyxa viridis TaxID=1274662 RepID=A0ABP1FTG8_9CHLO
MSKQDKAAEIIRDAVDAKIGESGANLKGTPEEVAERLIKEEGGQELKERELDLKGAEIKPGVAGSGIKRGEPAAVAQSAVDRASQQKEGATVMPEAAEKAKEMLVEEIRDAKYK